MLTDSHAHLTSSQFDSDREDIIARAAEAGVGRIVSIASDLDDSAGAVALADSHSSIHATVGVHPTSSHEIDDPDWLGKIRRLAASPRVVAIGEIGLDYYHPAPDGWTTESYHARQADFFKQQLDLAVELGHNVVIHQRDRGEACWRDILEIMQPYHGRLRAVFHCYIAGWADVAPLVDQGHLISFTGIVTFKNAKQVHQAVIDAAAGSFMVETDAPYLAPVPHRGKRCEPAYTRHTAEHIAQLRNETLEALAERTTQTANEFFRF